uniref:NADH-ubiquinone oxidoreductase chain 2 n=1 Tax=Neotrogla sp. 5 KY-2017 TaxID=2051645 RepID=A0A343QCA9_9NEOP|nr:NADH dehydrogenase subunit 2 [Neotrogla sp. 5 KY-2017]
MLNNLNILLLSTLTMSTLISISSSSWFSAWMGLEINLMSFIPLISNYKNSTSNESTMKYFLIQTIASVMLLFSSTLNSIIYNWSNNWITMFFNMIMMISLLLKTGAAPLHNWFIDMIEGLTWLNSFLILTWQKFAPLFFLFYCKTFNFLLILFILSSALTGSIGGLKQISLKKILAYSSINHLSWILTSMTLSKNLFILYLSFYSILNLSIIISLFLMNISFINQTFQIFKQKFLSKLIMFLPLLSLGGLPPFLGFIPKWMVINQLFSQSNIILCIFLMMFSLITLYFYLQSMYASTLLINNYESMNLWNFNLKQKTITFFPSLISILSFFIFPTCQLSI